MVKRCCCLMDTEFPFGKMEMEGGNDCIIV
jgi:hypothetical protein